MQRLKRALPLARGGIQSPNRLRSHKARRTGGHGAGGVHRKAAPFKHHLVLAAHQMRISQRQTQGARALRHNRLALGALAHVIRRGVKHRQHLSALCLGRLRRLGKPRVFANQQANVLTAHLKHTALVARLKVTPLIKHLVVGQTLLGVARHALTRVPHRGGVVRQWAAHAAAVRKRVRIERLRVPQHHMQPLPRRACLGHLLHRLLTVGQKRWAKVQVFGGVAGQGQLGGQQHIHPLRMGLLRGVDNALRIAA